MSLRFSFALTAALSGLCSWSSSARADDSRNYPTHRATLVADALRPAAKGFSTDVLGYAFGGLSSAGAAMAAGYV